jgi:predicted nucleic acid-binding protein
VATTPDLIASALDLHALRGISFYDAMVVQAAFVSGCQRVLSEDLQNGAVISKVRIENPFQAV